MNPQSHNDRTIWFVILIFVFFLVGSFIFTQYEIFQIKNTLDEKSVAQTFPTTAPFIPTTIPSISPVPSPTPSSKVTPTPSPKPVIYYPQGTSSPLPRITYIPLLGGSTQNTDWTNVTGSSFMLNISDYGSKAYAVWDANLRVDNSNGTTFVRIFDVTHGIVVNGSEISITDTSTSTDIVSGSLQFWQGNNSYIVQIKSLNSSTAFMDSGRIKINY